jgi:hypothetical protein
LNIASFIANGTPELLLESILQTRDEFDRDTPHGLKAGSDRWLYDIGYYRPILIESIKRNWGLLVDQEPHECPFNDDCIAHMWVSTRKSEYDLNQLREDLKKVRRDGGLF